MIYEHQINYANACDITLDIWTIWFALDPSVVPYSILTSRLLERMKNLEACTSYDF